MKNKKSVIIIVSLVVAAALLVTTVLVALNHTFEMMQKPKDIISDKFMYSSDESETMPPTTSALSLDKRFAKAKIGDIVTFGEYEIDHEDGIYYTENKPTTPIEWGVVDKNDKAVLLISKNAIDDRKFCEEEDPEKTSSCTWVNSSIRSWLNDDFYNNAFTHQEKAYILQSKLNNNSYSVKADDANSTYDNVFLLNVPEAEKYWGTTCTNLFHKDSTCKWLRSSGTEQYAPVNIDSTNEIDYNGAFDSYSMEIYPCMWVKIKDDYSLTEYDFDYEVAPPENVAEFDSGNCGDGGINVKWTLDERGTLRITGIGKMNNYQEYMHVNLQPWNEYLNRIHTVIIEDGVKYIGKETLSCAASLREVYCKGTDYEIGPSAFSNCISLKKVELSEGLTTIMDYAFEGCSSLTELNLPDSATTFGLQFIDRCDELKAVNGINVDEWKTQHNYDSLPRIDYE